MKDLLEACIGFLVTLIAIALLIAFPVLIIKMLIWLIQL